MTSTVGSNLGGAGSDPDQLVEITDTLADTSASQVTGENYDVLDTAALGQVYRGVALLPSAAPVPLPQPLWLLLSGLGALLLVGRRQRLV